MIGAPLAKEIRKIFCEERRLKKFREELTELKRARWASWLVLVEIERRGIL
jgi:hypothetical protein